MGKLYSKQMNVHWGYLVQRMFSVVRFNSQVLSYWNHDCLLFMTGLFVIGPENCSSLINVMGAFVVVDAPKGWIWKMIRNSFVLIPSWSFWLIFCDGTIYDEPGFFL